MATRSLRLATLRLASVGVFSTLAAQGQPTQVPPGPIGSGPVPVPAPPAAPLVPQTPSSPPALSLPPPSSEIDDPNYACQSHDDCYQGELCYQGGCFAVPPRPVPPPPVPPPTAPVPPRIAQRGEHCAGSVVCASHLRCEAGYCVDPMDDQPEHRGGFDLGYQLGPGLSGAISSPVPTHTLAATVHAPGSGFLRYQLQLGYHYLNGWEGLMARPIGLSFFAKRWGDSNQRLVLEPGLDLLEFELLVSDQGHTLLWGGRAWVRLVGYMGGFYASFTPLALRLRWGALAGDSNATEFTTGSSVDWPLEMAVGVSF